MNEYFKDVVRASKGDYVAWTLTGYNYNSDIRGKLIKGKVKVSNYVASCDDCLLCTYSYDLPISCQKIKNFKETIAKKELIYSNVSSSFPDLNYARDKYLLSLNAVLYILVLIFLFRFIGSIFRRS